jgi:diguanylate cyclase (GGDEF)-like protein
MPGPGRKSAGSWAVDVSVASVGSLIGVLAIVQFLRSDNLDLFWLTALVIGTPVIVLMSRFPLVLTRAAGGIEVGFDSAVLVFLACLHGGTGALAVWTLGQAISQLTGHKRMAVRFFNIGLGITSGAAALLTMRSFSGLDRTSPHELMAVGLGCAVYFTVDYALSAASIAIEERSRILDALVHGGGLAALGIFVSIDSLGYLGALVVRALPGWASVLLAVPVLTILVATRAISRGTEHRRRLAALFDASAAAQGLQTRDELLEVLREHSRAVVLSGAELHEQPPTDREIGAVVRTDDGDLWLVAPARDRARASVEADRRALEALATVGEQAFARLILVGEMDRLARHDSLTDLPNRTLFLDRVEHAVARSRRQEMSIAVLFLDLDGFKAVNDRFGHAAGDDLLNTVAKRLLGCVREGDSVARLGGDEFAVLLEDVGRPEDVELLARRLLSALRSEIVIAGHDVVVGTSIGVALAAPTDDAAGLLRNADMAMYRAKALGKDRFFVYQPSLREENIRRLELIEALRRGMFAGELVVHYQPVVDLESGAIDGIEALVRWQRGDVLVPPDSFISAAEDSGLIVELGQRVLAQVVADSRELVAAAGHPLNIGVNMSAHQLREPGFIDEVRRAVAALGDSQLVLEMTETVVVQDDEESAEMLRQLKAIGAQLAIDDFGVGFSSIGYLQHLPVDIIKIDRTFTRDIDSDPRAAALVEAILLMGSALELRVVAEGIERRTQVQRLRGSGCRTGQGFLFSQPLPLEEFVTTLRDRSAEQEISLAGSAWS